MLFTFQPAYLTTGTYFALINRSILPIIFSHVPSQCEYTLTLQAPRATLVNKKFLPLSATGDFSRHEEQAAYRHVKHWPLSALVA